MNTVGKILVVFVTACSLGFLAFVAALRNGGPDWQGELRSPDLQKVFTFTAEPGEKVTYSVKQRLHGILGCRQNSRDGGSGFEGQKTVGRRRE